MEEKDKEKLTEVPTEAETDWPSPEYLKARNAFLDRLERHTGQKITDRSQPEFPPEHWEKMRELQEKASKLSKEDILKQLRKDQEEDDRDYF